MHNITKDLFDTLGDFSSISLEQLNSTVSFLDRMDVKYLLHVSQLAEIIRELKDDFFILNIGGKSIFQYDNVYMDSKDYMFYYQHQHGEKNRTKVRTRHYVDAEDLAFFEYKQKTKGTTRKFRYQYGVKNHGKMTNEAMKFFEGIYMSMYSTSPKHLIFPSIGTRYKRFTLCSKRNDERLTIDMDLQLIELRDEENKGKIIEVPNLVIIESKSTHEHCFSHDVMKKHGIKKADACSKYCMWVYHRGHAKERSKFQPTLDTIKAIKKSKHREKTKAPVETILNPYTKVQS